jgi:hypothetical protein
MSKIPARAACTDYSGYYSTALEMDTQAVLMFRLVVLLDLLWDCTKDNTGIWGLISDVIEEMLLREGNEKAPARKSS